MNKNENEPIPQAHKPEEKYLDEPIYGVLIWHIWRNPVPVKATMVGMQYQEYARASIWHPLIKDESSQIASDTPMHEVYVPYDLYHKLQLELKKLKANPESVFDTKFIAEGNHEEGHYVSDPEWEHKPYFTKSDDFTIETMSDGCEVKHYTKHPMSDYKR